MHHLHVGPDARRRAPRVLTESLCNEIAGGIERPVMVVDISESGVRIERPYVGGRTPRELQLEFELPGVDAIIWARGQTCFDQVRQVHGDLWRTTGIRLAAAASSDLRLLRDFVHESRRAMEIDDRLCFASVYLRG
jgi:hypothetical protein